MSRVFPMEHNVVLVRIKSALEAAGFRNVWFDHISEHYLGAFKMNMGPRCPFRDTIGISRLLGAVAVALGLDIEKRKVVVSVRSTRVHAAITLQATREGHASEPPAANGDTGL